METRKSSNILRRYTDMPALLYLLQHKKITLLDPKNWDDTNDSYYLLQYKKKKTLKTVLALCLTEAEETYHHWRIFSHGTAGVCINFNRETLVNTLSVIPGMTLDSVTYCTVNKARKFLNVKKLPFLKRTGFTAEAEFRAVYESKKEIASYFDVKITLDSILKISLSPWLDKRLFITVKSVVHSIPGCENLAVTRSSLVGNSEWKKLADELT